MPLKSLAWLAMIIIYVYVCVCILVNMSMGVRGQGADSGEIVLISLE